MDKYLNDKIVTKYLFNDLSEKEKIYLEELYFSDSEAFEFILAIEDELIEKYTLGNLTKKENKLFELNYLYNQQVRENIRSAKVRIDSISKMSVANSTIGKNTYHRIIENISTFFEEFINFHPVVKYGFITGMFLILIGTWFTVRFYIIQNDVKDIQTEISELKEKEKELHQQLLNERGSKEKIAQRLQAELLKKERIAKELDIIKQKKIPLLSFVLSPGLLRSLNEYPKLALPSGNYLVSLQLDIESEKDYTLYRAMIKTIDGSTIWSQDALKHIDIEGSKSVNITVQSQVLANDKYRLTLIGKDNNQKPDTVGKYYFAIVK